MYSLLSGSNNYEKIINTSIRFLHQSFPEYLTNPRQCDQRLYIDPAAGHARLAALCFRHLASLRRNPCKINHLALMNETVQVQVPSRNIDECIPRPLQYSCLHVAEHVTAASHQYERQLLVTAFATFCESKLLFWIEVLSYLGQIDRAMKALGMLCKWYSVRVIPTLLISLEAHIHQRFLPGYT